MEEDGESRYKITDIIGEGIIPKFNNIVDRDKLQFMKALANETSCFETESLLKMTFGQADVMDNRTDY